MEKPLVLAYSQIVKSGLEEVPQILYADSPGTNPKAAQRGGGRDFHPEEASQSDAASHSSGIFKDCAEVVRLQLRVVGENLALAHPRGKLAQHIPNRDAQATDARLA